MDPLSQKKIAEKELYEFAKKKAKKRQDFYIHLFVYTIGMSLWLLKKYTNLTIDFLPFRYINWFVMSIWTFAIVIQTVEMIVSEMVFGKKWEDKQVKNILEEKSEKQTWE